jgi:hypothetical protein
LHTVPGNSGESQRSSNFSEGFRNTGG